MSCYYRAKVAILTEYATPTIIAVNNLDQSHKSGMTTSS